MRDENRVAKFVRLWGQTMTLGSNEVIVSIVARSEASKPDLVESTIVFDPQSSSHDFLLSGGNHGWKDVLCQGLPSFHDGWS